MNKKWLCVSYIAVVFFSAFCVFMWIRARNRGQTLAFLLELDELSSTSERVNMI